MYVCAYIYMLNIPWHPENPPGDLPRQRPARSAGRPLARKTRAAANGHGLCGDAGTLGVHHGDLPWN